MRASPQVVVDEATLPAEDAYEFGAVAPNAEELARQWLRFGLSGEPVDIDFDSKVVLLVGFGESGSCPYEYAGVDVDFTPGRLTLLDAREGSGACTADYNPRTIGLAIDRSLLPDGVFRVEPPNGAAVSVAAEPVERPPPEEPDVVSASISAVYVTLDPEPVAAGGQLHVGVRNDSDAQVATGGSVRLDRWTGLGFEAADPPKLRIDNDVVIAEPGDHVSVLTANLAEHDLEPGWYRITVDLDVTTGDFGRLLIRRAVEVV